MKRNADLLVEFKTVSDEYGSLSFFESGKDILFEFKRIYYTYSVPVGTKRGKHAHKKLKQLLWCPYGKIKIILDDGTEKREFILNSSNKAIHVPNGYWHDMYWLEKDSILCVAASDYYDENDYIRDYDKFLELKEKGYWNHEN